MKYLILFLILIGCVEHHANSDRIEKLDCTITIEDSRKNNGIYYARLLYCKGGQWYCQKNYRNLECYVVEVGKNER